MERQTTLPSLSLSRTEWDSVKKKKIQGWQAFVFTKAVFSRDLLCHTDKTRSHRVCLLWSGLHHKEDAESSPLKCLFSPRIQNPTNSPGDWLEIKRNTEKKDVYHRKNEKCMLGVIGWVFPIILNVKLILFSCLTGFEFVWNFLMI